MPGESSGGEAVPGGRVAELDSLRGMAAVAILVFHARASWLPGGWAAVDLFFVLSGYLITSIIIRDGGTPGFLRNFYIRRGLRTWPIYYLVIALLVALSPVLVRRFDWAGLSFALTYTQGLPRLWSGAGGRFTVYLGHTWSLAVEEQFYLLWPAMVLLAGRRRLPVLALVCAGGSVLARSRGILEDSLLSRADGLALGGWLAAYRLGVRPSAGRSRAIPASVVTLLPALVACLVLGVLSSRGGLGPNGGHRDYPGLTGLAFNLLWLGLIDLVLTHAGRPGMWLLRLRPLRYLGAISYGLYLYHLPLMLIAVDIASRLGYSGDIFAVRLLAVLASIPIAGLSWRYIERPLLNLKRRYPYRRAADEAGPPYPASTGRFPRRRSPHGPLDASAPAGNGWSR
jgi:peptidoglycan/LPS O-acetylase OafA/YrhL